jgi:YHS domain-containing protein
MYRLLIIVGLLVMFYFLLRSAIREFRDSKGRSQALDANNLLVQDPVCRIYVERDSAVSASIGGQTYYFCSKGCAQTFQKQLAG